MFFKLVLALPPDGLSSIFSILVRKLYGYPAALRCQSY